MAKITDVPATTKQNAGRVIFLENDNALNADIIAARADLTTHKLSSSSDHNTWGDARYAPISSTKQIVISVPFTMNSGTKTPYIPLPIGTITRVVLTSDDSNVGAITFTGTAVTVLDSILRIVAGTSGLWPISLNGTTIGTVSMSGAAQLAIITMSIA